MSFEQTLTAFVPDDLFKGACILAALEYRDNSSLQSKGQTCLLSTITKIMFPFRAKVRQAYCPYTRLGFPKLRFHSYNATHCLCKGHWALSVSHCGNWGLGNWPNDDILATAIAVNIETSLWFIGCSASIHETVAGSLAILQVE